MFVITGFLSIHYTVTVAGLEKIVGYAADFVTKQFVINFTGQTILTDCNWGLRHDEFAVLGQFCAKIITSTCLYPYTICSCKTVRKISLNFIREN